ncbi:hypothetical protein C0585_00990 [Candidatus Woesearchaeota archaeon]|uniref:hypothetical protein n=1 Tax=uncultured Arcobacter sp. TaxID=165434 RepID=UPI000CB52A3A|nr:hypothetical protein [uncultured Arcobacter sp.]PLW80759.1 MAG: hypothetical protein C0585_00990 [Candidatus Woesearchaeota archaeon]
MKLNKLFVYLIIGMFLITLASAEVQTLGTFKQGDNVEIQQTCSNCTYVNLQSVTYPNSTTEIIDIAMTQNGYYYNYDFNKTSSIGSYIVSTCGDPDGVVTCVNYDYYVTPTGEISNNVSVSLQIFVSLSCLFLMLIFLYFSTKTQRESILPNGVPKKEDNLGLKLFFYGLSFIFLISHVLITQIVLQNVFGENFLTSVYTIVTWILLMVATLISLYTVLKITFMEVDNFKRRTGLK